MPFKYKLAVLQSILHILLVLSCHSQDKIKAVQIKLNVPIQGQDGKIIGLMKDTIRFYYYQDIVLYKETNLNNEQIWFVYNKNSKRGYSFYEADETRNHWEFVDTFLNQNGMLRMQLNFLIEESPIRLFTKQKLPEQGILEEGYVFTDPKFVKDTLYISYSDRLKDLPFSFDKKVDSVKGSKLFRIRTVTGAKHIPEMNVTTDRVETLTEMKEAPIDEQEKVARYIARFRSQKKEISELRP